MPLGDISRFDLSTSTSTKTSFVRVDLQTRQEPRFNTRWGMRNRLCSVASVMVGVAGAMVLVDLSHIHHAEAEELHFIFDTSVDVGSDVGGLNDWHWDTFLGLDLDEVVSVGGIVGSRNATVTPEIDLGILGTIPAITADTRTGLEIKGELDARAGLELYADFDAGGLSDTAAFDFAPTLHIEQGYAVGEMIQLGGSLGLSSSNYSQDQIDLPSISLGMDAVFELDMDLTVAAAVPIVLPYREYEVGPDPINERVTLLSGTVDMEPDQDDSGFPELSLLPGLEVDLLPDFGLDVLPDHDPADPVYSKQISIEPKPYTNSAGETIQPKAGFNIDIGEIQLFKPVRDETLFVETSIEDNAISYSVDTNILSLGVDIDGIISAALAGQSFTEFEVEIPTIGDFRAELLDFKYGPELGYKQDQTIAAELLVTLSFDQSVLVKQDGVLTLLQAGQTFEADWSDLPEVSLLGEEAVNVTVAFDGYQATMTQRGAITLGDYWEFSALELEFDAYTSIPGISPSLQLGPVVHERGAGLSSIYGEIELEVFNEEKSLGTYDLEGHVSDQQFVLQATPSTKVYLSEDALNGTSDLTERNAWRTVTGDVLPSASISTAVSDFSNQTLVIGSKTDENGVTVLSPTTFYDSGSGGEVVIRIPKVTSRVWSQDNYIPSSYGYENRTFLETGPTVKAEALRILKGSEYHQSGNRLWELARIQNDGLYSSDGLTRFTAKDGSLVIQGSGRMEFNELGIFDADLLSNGQGHTLFFGPSGSWDNTASFDGIPYSRIYYQTFTIQGQTFRVPIGTEIRRIEPNRYVSLNYTSAHFVSSRALPQELSYSGHTLDINQTVVNAGKIEVSESSVGLNLSQKLQNTLTGHILANNGGVLAITTDLIENDGVLEAKNGGTLLMQNSGGMQLFSDSYDNPGTQGVYRADSSGLIDFVHEVRADGDTVFEAQNGGVIRFRQELTQAYGTDRGSNTTRLVTDETGTILLNGLGFDTITFDHDRYEGVIEVENKGLLEVQSGQNLLFYQGPASNNPGGGTPDPVPEVKTINLDNTGTVRILDGAEFGFEIEITNYDEGGATLTGGTWELIGQSMLYDNTTAVTNTNRSQVAALTVQVAEVSDLDGNILNVFNGKVDGDFDGDGDANGDGIADDPFDLSHFDTQLKTNAANVLLSGAAYFPYFNTIEHNAGTWRLADQHRFTTQGDLLNTGHIQVDSSARLNVAGQLTIDEGALYVTDGGVVDVQGQEGVHVQGGSLIYERTNPGELAINSKWVVQDKWLGVDEQGQDVIAAGYVEYTDSIFPTIGSLADITLSGSQAKFVGLQGVNRIDGRLAITDGNTFVRSGADQALVNYGTFEITNGGSVYVGMGDAYSQLTTAQAEANLGDFNNYGTFILDDSSYMRANRVWLGGDTQVNGVLHANQILTDTQMTLQGAGTIAADVFLNGQLNPGNSAGRLEIYGDLYIESPATMTFEILGGVAGESYDQLVVHGGWVMDGSLHIEFDQALESRAGQSWLLLDLIDANQQINLDNVRGDLFDLTTVTGLQAALSQASASSIVDGWLVGSLGGRNVYLSATGGDGNDLTLITDGLAGDIVEDGILDAQDIDSLFSALRLAETVGDDLYYRAFDLNDDGVMDEEDAVVWVMDMFGTNFGDATLDGEVSLLDLDVLGRYYNQFGGWSDGDFNGDGRVTLLDLDILGRNYGRSELAALIRASVPEPVVAGWGLAVLTLIVRRRRAA